MVVGTTADLQLYLNGLDFSMCIVGTVIEETRLFGSGEPMYAKVSVPPIPDREEFLMLELPRNPWFGGAIRLPDDPLTKRDNDFLKALELPTLEDSYHKLQRAFANQKRK